MNKDLLFGALVSAVIVTATGTVLAAGGQTGIDSRAGGSGDGATMSQMAQATPSAQPDAATPKEPEMPSATSPEPLGSAAPSAAVPSTAAPLAAIPSESAIGKQVTNAEGDKIGEVTKVTGDSVIVSVGGFLGIGSHDVALSWKELTTTGSGDDMKLVTALTKDEIKDMPAYKE